MSDKSPLLMKCGCAAQGARTATKGVKHDPIPCCVIHDCLEPAESAPDLYERKARCAYYGGKVGRNNECNYGQSRQPTCLCEQPSSLKLPFFEHKPQAQFDKFYCGCHGWD